MDCYVMYVSMELTSWV